MKSIREMDPDQLNESAMDVLRLIVSEFETDPTSVQCFDLRIVERAKRIIAERRRRDKEIASWFR